MIKRFAATILGAASIGPAAPAAPPLPAPSIFAPGIVSGPQNDGTPSFTPDGRSMFFERSYGRRSAIYFSTWTRGAWSTPAVAPFNRLSDQQPAVSPDGRSVYYASVRQHRDPNGVEKRSSHVFRVERRATGWSLPVELPDAVNISDRIFRPSVDRDGTIIFMSPASEGKGAHWRLFSSTWSHGRYSSAAPLPFSDGAASDVDPYIAPDGSFIIFSSQGRQKPDDGHEHLQLSCRVGPGWGPVTPLRYQGDDWDADDGEPELTPDGRTLLFSSARSPKMAADETPAESRQALRRAESWDNGNANVWSLPFARLLEANEVQLCGTARTAA